MNIEEILEKALGMGEEGRWEDMASELREALPDHAENPAVLCWLGVAERELGMDGVAYERFKAALAMDPEDPHILATAGSGIAAFDDPDAESALRAAAILGPQVVEARWLYGAYLAREGLFQDAFRELEAAVELAPEDGSVLLEMGAARALAGEMDAAARWLGEAVVAVPEDGWPRILLGLVQLERNELPEAAAELEAGARIMPEDVEAQLLTALAAVATDSEGLAYEMVERARIRGAEEDAGLLGEVDEKLDEGPEAAREFLVRELGPGILRDRLMVRP